MKWYKDLMKAINSLLGQSKHLDREELIQILQEYYNACVRDTIAMQDQFNRAKSRLEFATYCEKKAFAELCELSNNDGHSKGQ